MRVRRPGRQQLEQPPFVVCQNWWGVPFIYYSISLQSRVLDRLVRLFLDDLLAGI